MPRAKKRILVLTRPKNPDDPMAGTHPLGTPREVGDALGKFNTRPESDGASRSGTVMLYGPGFTVEYTTAMDTLHQAMVIVHNTDFAWPVLSKICRANQWKMQDTDSGQYFG